MIGWPLQVARVSTSVSAAGVIRGVPFADVPPGRAKYVMCTTGAVLDVVVDIRVGSPTFGEWTSLLLDEVDLRAIYVSEGLCHAFCSLQNGSTVTYLCSTGYSPGAEHSTHPLDEEVGISWPTAAKDGSPLRYELSGKDQQAPTPAQARADGLLTTRPALPISSTDSSS